MATETVLAGNQPAVPAQTESDPLGALERTLDDVVNRAMGVSAILEAMEFYDMAAREGAQEYAMATTVELVLKRLVIDAQEAIGKVEAARFATRQEVSHG